MEELIEYDLTTRIIKVISGGQTGADEGGLEAGRICGVPTGGTAPSKFRTSNGNNIKLKTVYGLNDHTSRDWAPRTKLNVKDSNFTLILGNHKSPGSKLAIDYCVKYKRDYAICNNLNDEDLQNVVAQLKKKQELIILNVAGNRNTKENNLYNRTVDFVTKIIKAINGEDICDTENLFMKQQ